MSNPACEPFTPRGVAAFARAGLGRLLLVQLIVALIASASLTWFLSDNCFSLIRTAIHNLPDTGKISGGRLDWPGDSPELLAEGKFLALDVDLDHSGAIHSTADVQVEFGRDSIRIYSLLGYSEIFYVPDRFAPFNRTDLEPLWGAWSAEILFLTAVAILLGLILSWAVLAALYFWPVWLLGLFTNRDLNFRASWKLCGAALMPGALLMTVAVLLYNLGFLNLVSFGFVFLVHLLVGWIYAVSGLIFLPPVAGKTSKGNPFKPSK